MNDTDETTCSFYKPNRDIRFCVNDNLDEPIVELRENGDIFVKGKLCENDKELVDAFRQFLMTGKRRPIE